MRVKVYNDKSIRIFANNIAKDDVMDRLEINIIDVIREEQIKLGYRKEKIRLYYPLASLNSLMDTQLDNVHMVTELNEYFDKKKEIFGEVEISYKAERFCIVMPEKAVKYVNDHTDASGFLYDFINVIGKHDAIIEDVLRVFNQYSESIYFEKMKDAEFDYLVYFQDGQPDSYRYCLTEEGHHLIYHRYTKEDYDDLF